MLIHTNNIVLHSVKIMWNFAQSFSLYELKNQDSVRDKVSNGRKPCQEITM